MKTFLKIIGTLLAIIVIVAIAGFAWFYHDTHRPPREAAEYVALGSSFASGPGVGEQDPYSPHFCLRSIEDYPHLLAQKRHLQLRDMSCGGATTKHILYGGQFLQGPQVDALDANTQLVTVTIGGNDVAYMASLFAASCRTGSDKMPLWMRGGVCNLPLTNNVDAKLQELTVSLRKVADVVHQRSPHAQLLFIDYTTSLPATGNCPDRLPITDEDLEHGRQLAEKLRQVTAEAAQQSGALLIQASEITRAHDVCSSDPWVFDWRFTPSHHGWGPMAYHPTEKAMQAIADAIDARLNEIDTK